MNPLIICATIALFGLVAVAMADGPLRLGAQDPSTPTLVFRPTQGPDMIRFCQPGETALDDCVVSSVWEDREEEESSGAERASERRSAAPERGESRRVTVERRPDGFAVSIDGAPTRVTTGVGGSGHVTVRSEDRTVGDGTEPSVPGPDDRVLGHRELSPGAGRVGSPSVSAEVTIAPSGALSISQ